MENDKIHQVGVNIQEKATVIWNVANAIFGIFKPHEYGKVILPMTVIKRFHDCLAAKHAEVLAAHEKYANLAPGALDMMLMRASGYKFYNTSKFTFETLVADPNNIETNFRSYLAGFSRNVQDILANFRFEDQLNALVENNLLFLVVKEFASPKGYLGPDKISAVDCGYIFEELVRRFSESYAEDAGAHFTSRDIIYLMTDLLLSGSTPGEANVTVYDMTMGTSQMLSCMEERIHALNPATPVTCCGQELNAETFAIAMSDMLIRGGNPDNMRYGDTLSDDKFGGYRFRYIISNPPFGIDWKREEKAVKDEHARGEAGRFAPRLPDISDGQQLFLLNGLSKLDREGRMAIIQNGSSLSTGDAGRGPSEIRRYILEHDWLDAIVQLPSNSFMNTPIATYVWLLARNKPAHRRGKVRLINASRCFEPRRKSIGYKRNDITAACRELIMQAYVAFERDASYGDPSGIFCESKVFDTQDFGYYKITVERPQRDEAGNIIMKKGKPVPDKTLRNNTENVPMTEDIQTYMEREVLPYVPDAWVDEKATKVGYEIPMTRYFYKYQPPEASDSIVARISSLESDIAESLKNLFS